MVFISLFFLSVCFFSGRGIQTLHSQVTGARLRLPQAVSVPVEFKVCWRPRLISSRNLDRNSLADVGCHLHTPQEYLARWSGDHTEDFLEGVHSHLGTEGFYRVTANGHQQRPFSWETSRQILEGEEECN